MAVNKKSQPPKYRLTDRQPFFLWVILFGLLLQVDHLRRISSNANQQESSDTSTRGVTPVAQQKPATPAIRSVEKTKTTVYPKPPLLNRYKVPNVLLVGVQKAATNSVASWIYRHLNVCQPKQLSGDSLINGAHFFNTDETYYQVGIDSYGKHFSHCNAKNHSIIMDATPDYFNHADRVRDTYDLLDGPYGADLKIIMILREPVEREYSWYSHLVGLSKEEKCPRHVLKRVQNADGSPRNFQAYLDNVILPEFDTDHGLYDKWLDKWLNHFQRKQIFIMSFDEIRDNPKSVMKRLRNYLGLKPDPNEDLSEINNVAHKGGVQERPLISCQTQKSYASKFQESNKKFYDLVATKNGPEHEINPFPKFKLGECKEWQGQENNKNDNGNNNSNKKKP